MTSKEEIADDLEEEINQTDLLPTIENGLHKNGFVKKVSKICISNFIKQTFMKDKTTGFMNNCYLLKESKITNQTAPLLSSTTN